MVILWLLLLLLVAAVDAVVVVAVVAGLNHMTVITYFRLIVIHFC